MDAGRELDKHVAIHIFDWSDFWENGILLYGHSPGERAMGIDAERSPVPHYSTDIAAAWLVVEHLRERGYRLNMYESLLGGEYVAMFIGEKGSQCGGTTAPHAICLSALKAVGA